MKKGRPILFILIFILALMLFVSCDDKQKENAESTPEPQPTETAKYKVGDIGPAGGIIFYVKDSYSEGWRYLEAAKDALPGQYEWGSSGSFKTKTNLGTGKSNTKILLDAKAEKPSLSFPPAEACADYGKGTDYNDWFLPSKVELVIMMTKLEEITGKTDTNSYWSSSEYPQSTTWSAYYVRYEYVESTGYRGYNSYASKTTIKYYVRPIRSF